MSAQIIKLSDRRTRPTPSSSLIDLQLSFFLTYVDISLAAYHWVVNAAEQGWKAFVCHDD
jgi:hypothetical protein